MKKILVFAYLVLCLISCTDDEMVVDGNTGIKIRSLAYQPIGKPEEILLSNGGKIYMDIDSTYYYQDMIFSREQVRAMTAPTTRSAVIKSKVNYWPNKIIYYKINGFDSGDITTITNALQAITSHTNIQFIETNNLPQHHILFEATNNSYASPIGMQDNGNTILLSHYMYLGDVLHEVMHSLGFFHEHARSDRDSFVNIFWGNIEEGKEYNFYKYTDRGYQGYDVGYFDFNSVMIYGSYECSKYPHTEYTINRKHDQLSGFIQENNYSLSSGDIEGLKFVYGPENLHLNSEVIYENCYDDNEYIEYENYVDFRDNNGNPVILDHPRLVVVTYYEYRYDRASGQYTNYFIDEYHVVPAGSSACYLNITEYTHEEEGYGIVHTHYETSYSVNSY